MIQIDTQKLVVRNKNVTSRVHTGSILKNCCLTIFIISVMKIDLRPPDSLSLPEKVSGGLSHSLDRARLFGFFDKEALGQIDSRFLGKALTGRYARPH